MRRRLSTEERRELRRLLMDAGFVRTPPTTLDDGTGRYTETFARGNNIITIEWDSKWTDVDGAA